jgi:hypothetical protein
MRRFFIRALIGICTVFGFILPKTFQLRYCRQN